MKCNILFTNGSDDKEFPYAKDYVRETMKKSPLYSLTEWGFVNTRSNANK